MEDSYDSVLHKIASFRDKIKQAGQLSSSSSQSSNVSFVTNLNASISDCIKPQKSLPSAQVKTSVAASATGAPNEGRQVNDAKQGREGGGGNVEYVTVINRVSQVVTWRPVIVCFTVMTWTNSITLLAQTWLQIAQSYPGQILRVIDDIFLFFYAGEACLKLLQYKSGYFNSNANIWDLAVLISNLLAFCLSLSPLNANSLASQCFQTIKVLRMIRTIRGICLFNGLFAILCQSGTSLCTIGIMMLLTTYTFAVIGCGIYGDVVPRHFSSVFISFSCLFRQLTLSHWNSVYTDAASVGRQDVAVFLVVYLLINYFTFFNLVTAVFVDSFSLCISRNKRSNSIHPESDTHSTIGQGLSICKPSLVSEKTRKVRSSPNRTLFTDNKESYCDLVALLNCCSKTYRSNSTLADFVLSTSGDL